MQHLADYVNPYIGSISHMLASCKPEVMLPYGMARSTPVMTDCGDYYCNDRVQGYPLGKANVMPGRDGAFDNSLDHSREDFRCYYLRAELEEMDIVAESTVTRHVYLHRFTGANELRLRFPNGEAEEREGCIAVRIRREHPKFEVFEYILVALDCPLKVLRREGEEWVLRVPKQLLSGAPSPTFPLKKPPRASRRRRTAKISTRSPMRHGKSGTGSFPKPPSPATPRSAKPSTTPPSSAPSCG